MSETFRVAKSIVTPKLCTVSHLLFLKCSERSGNPLKPEEKKKKTERTEGTQSHPRKFEIFETSQINDRLG